MRATPVLPLTSDMAPAMSPSARNASVRAISARFSLTSARTAAEKLCTVCVNTFYEIAGALYNTIIGQLSRRC